MTRSPRVSLNRWLLDQPNFFEHRKSEVLGFIKWTKPETSTEELLQILSGQPEFEEKWRLPELGQLRQRIMLRCKTAPLTHMERLKTAGGDGNTIFGPKALGAIQHSCPSILSVRPITHQPLAGVHQA